MEIYRDEGGATYFYSIPEKHPDSQIESVQLLPESTTAHMVLFTTNPSRRDEIKQYLEISGVPAAHHAEEQNGLIVSDPSLFSKALDILSERKLIPAADAKTIQSSLPRAISSAVDGEYKLESLPKLLEGAPASGITHVQQLHLKSSSRPSILHGEAKKSIIPDSLGDYGLANGRLYPVSADAIVDVLAEEDSRAKEILVKASHSGGEKSFERFDDMNLRGSDIVIAFALAGKSIETLLSLMEKPTQNFLDAINNHPDKLSREPVVAKDANRLRGASYQQGCFLN